MTFSEAKKIYLEAREKINAIGLAFYLNSIDVETESAPPRAMEYRGKQLSALNAMVYDMSTSPEFVEAIKTLDENSRELETDLAREIMLKREESEKLLKIPREEYIAYEELLNSVYPVYVEAKNKSDFSLFEPYLQKIFDFNRKYAKWLGTEERSGYDVLLNEYERGYGRREYDKFFGLLKERIVPLVKKISKKRLDYNRSFIEKSYSVEGQKKFAEYIRDVMCFDRERTAMLESEHPFTINNGCRDVRITNHFYENSLSSAIFSAIHEMGHGLYELQIDEKYDGTGASGGASLAIHESQSRFMENMIARSLAFWQTHFNKLSEIFPCELAGITAEDFTKHVCEVEESLIRTEADELTYSLHVLIRYEIESAVMQGEIEAREIPRVWNEKYKEYLGVDVPSDKEGCLQDMHWAGGSLGYFPTYSLGSAYAAQIYNAMSRDIDIDAEIRTGNIKAIADWLRERLHRFGSSKFPKELILLATGEPFNPEYYVSYLEKKYTELYGI